MLLNNLPEQGSIEKMINKRNIRNKISFSSEELDKLELKTNEQGIAWKPIDDIEVEFTNTEIKFVYEVIESISEKGLISEGILDFIFELKSNLPKEEESNDVKNEN